METLIAWTDVLRKACRQLAPYLLVELLLPGGTLLAILLFVYRQRRGGAPATRLAALFAAMPAPIPIAARRRGS
ncbi:MAG TPA: hypothetical protein VMV45_12460 [Casimicrobiaceae bacterium]|nr:hypothetical protein [Casimicrobiaceae bacterium]